MIQIYTTLNYIIYYSPKGILHIMLEHEGKSKSAIPSEV